MKNKILILAFLFLSVFSSAFSQSTPDWRWVHPRPQGQYINWFKMVTPTVWYAVGEYGSVIKTTDAGTTWRTFTGGYPQNSYPGAGIFNNNRCAWFFDQNNGLIGVNACRGIAKITGGAVIDTIQIIPSGSGTTNAFYFINSTTGYLVGNSTFKAMKTTNAGLNWVQLQGLGTTTLYGVYASDTNNIIISTTAGNVLKTTNAGVNWTTINTSSTATLNDMVFTNANTGYVCGSSGVFRYTTNAGLNWAGTNPPVTTTMQRIIVSGSEIFMAGTGADAIFKSTDLGTSWTTINTSDPSQITPYGIYGLDKTSSTILIAGSYGGMNISTNNGANWANINKAISMATMQDIWAQNGSGRVIAIGYDIGKDDGIFYSTNGGSSWSSSHLNAANFVSNIKMLNNTTGWVSGRFGTFYKTTNGGASWDTTMNNNPTLTNYFLNGVDFVNETTGWVAGGVPGIGGTTNIFKTTNGGLNWIEQTSAYSGPVAVKIDMVNANIGWIGGQGQLQKTTNGGTNWVNQLTPTGAIQGMKALDSLTCFAVSSSTVVYQTTNGGANWNTLPFPVTGVSLFNTDWLDKNNGVVCGVIGFIAQTTNGGTTWTLSNNGGYTVYSVKMVHPDTMYAVAGNTAGGQVFKYVKTGPTGVITYEAAAPKSYTLKQNYPNPFNPSTTIEFDLPKAGNVTLKIFDLAGREYESYINNMNLNTGKFKTVFDAAGLSSGVYFYSLSIDGNVVDTKKMLLVK
jgi:photosystem II stability/assembly factor-like uncharacterized protein